MLTKSDTSCLGAIREVVFNPEPTVRGRRLSLGMRRSSILSLPLSRVLRRVYTPDTPCPLDLLDDPYAGESPIERGLDVTNNFDERNLGLSVNALQGVVENQQELPHRNGYNTIADVTQKGNVGIRDDDCVPKNNSDPNCSPLAENCKKASNNEHISTSKKEAVAVTNFSAV